VTRIAVVGNGGSGKTWLALRLSDVLRFSSTFRISCALVAY
jgi:GTPase SAR1 family protein